jgi:hypothetical protein
VNSIRWEIIRDGIEDYDYLVMLREGIRRLEQTQPNSPLLARAREVYNLQHVVPNLVGFARDPNVLLDKRNAIGAMISEME